ncbi:uncharacterized protein PAC_10072 [Phialocephala subalpina]|uniref:2EXR domain-containing protein n=1 Tax=Phialocephala subalpina TaxID=576137 RepID=A0A1L7X582_9HELO|nr:uncharacterized protein PAC_10072 [Phialocephala subalpina]
MEGTDESSRTNAMNLREPEREPTDVALEENSEQSNGWEGATEAQGPDFTLFTELPTEIRVQIWSLSLTPRIVRWIRNNEENVFNAPSKSLPLFETCRESRDSAILYGSYKRLSAASGKIWFSPIIDHLFFDPGWIDLVDGPHVTRQVDPLNSLLPELESVRNIMVHPNYTDERKKPTALFEKFNMLETVLVAADERSIGIQSKFMLGTVYDIKLYYDAMVKKRKPDVRVPYIAVGCLGWVGNERRTMHHGDGDNRRLVAVCDNHAQMTMHLNSVREEEWRFIQERRSQPRLALNLHWRHNPEATCQLSSTGPKNRPTSPGLPSYSDAVSSQEETVSEVAAPTAHLNTQNSKWYRLNRWCQKLLHR